MTHVHDYDVIFPDHYEDVAGEVIHKGYFEGVVDFRGLSPTMERIRRASWLDARKQPTASDPHLRGTDRAHLLPEPMRQEIRNRLTMTRGLVAAEVPAPAADVRRFASVVPQPDGSYRVLRFDVPSEALAEGRYLAPEELMGMVSQRASTVDEAEEALRNLDVDPESMDVPWSNDYPL